MSIIDPQEFGELRAQVQRLLESDKEKADQLSAISENVTAMRLQMAEARGGWKAVMLLGGASATLGGLATTWLSHLFGKGPT